MRVVCCLVAVVLSACGRSGAAAHGDSAPDLRDAGADAGLLADDRDGDGLCDHTELQFGTDPRSADSDGDGLPDLIELANGFDPVGPQQPASDQVAWLQARGGAAIDFPVRTTVDGEGLGLSGYFESVPSIYSDGSSAQDFYGSTLAVSADPVDAVRSIDSESARFFSVLGHTRLGFSLHFAYTADAPAIDCARAYPFRYGIKSDDGKVVSERLYLLVVSSSASSPAATDYCVPFGCE